MIFTNEVINKKKLQNIMSLTFHNYGIVRSSLISDNVKNLTFHYATISGISLSLEDLRVPCQKKRLIGLTRNPPDLAILDIKMPRMDGEELLKKLKKKMSIPIIFLTSKDEIMGII